MAYHKEDNEKEEEKFPHTPLREEEKEKEENNTATTAAKKSKKKFFFQTSPADDGPDDSLRKVSEKLSIIGLQVKWHLRPY